MRASPRPAARGSSSASSRSPNGRGQCRGRDRSPSRPTSASVANCGRWVRGPHHCGASEMTARFSMRIVAERTSISVVEVASSDEARTVRVSDGRHSWDVNLPSWYFPSLAILSDTLTAIWAVTTLYLLQPRTQPSRLISDDEIHSVYLVDHNRALCTVCELSV